MDEQILNASNLLPHPQDLHANDNEGFENADEDNVSIGGSAETIVCAARVDDSSSLESGYGIQIVTREDEEQATKVNSSHKWNTIGSTETLESGVYSISQRNSLDPSASTSFDDITQSAVDAETSSVSSRWARLKNHVFSKRNSSSSSSLASKVSTKKSLSLQNVVDVDQPQVNGNSKRMSLQNIFSVFSKVSYDHAENYVLLLT